MNKNPEYIQGCFIEIEETVSTCYWHRQKSATFFFVAPANIITWKKWLLEIKLSSAPLIFKYPRVHYIPYKNSFLTNSIIWPACLRECMVVIY